MRMKDNFLWQNLDFLPAQGRGVEEDGGCGGGAAAVATSAAIKNAQKVAPHKNICL